MLVLGEVKCLHCGHSGGDWVGERGASLLAAGLRDNRSEASDPNSPIRCARCEGPVFLDAAGPVRSTARIRRIQRLRRQLAALGHDPRAA